MSSEYRALSASKTGLLVTLLALWVLAESSRRDELDHARAHWHDDSPGFAASDFVKSVVSLLVCLISRQLQRVRSLSTISRVVLFRASPVESYPGLPTSSFHAHAQDIPTSAHDHSGCRGIVPVSFRHPRSSTVNLTLGNVRSTLAIFVVGLVYTLRAYTNLRIQEFVDPFTPYLALPVTVLGILSILRIVSWRNFPLVFYHACILQFAGFFITRSALFDSTSLDYSHLVASAFCNSMWISFVDLIYELHPSSPVPLLNTVIFAQSSFTHSLLFLMHASVDESMLHRYHIQFATAIQSLQLIEGAKDIVIVLIIQHYGSLCMGIFISLASSLLITIDTWRFTEASSHSAFLGCLVGAFGFGTFILCEQHTAEQHHVLISARRWFFATIISLVALGYIVAITSQAVVTNSSDLPSMSKKFSDPPGSPSGCHPSKSSTSSTAHPFVNYTHFKNVLLVVFFSHARYDSNLDFHNEVYGDYFPNIIYIGPASREDRGFAHSYDVLVDSFQSDEDLSNPLFYKMSGRMAHHMLYTALREYDCYDGYLWVPFDTLLNVPRLQHFDQSLFWYHSPWGQHVPNLALGNFTGPDSNSSRHAPPAMISPDTSINLTETWRGWGPDWWWGDPHVGVSVCMSAFDKVPEEMRARLAERTDGETRLIGGSADTLYVPGRHRKAFMDVLALFLETNCFLEIATPTTLHLVVPAGEAIQFVDHWWIYQPPFNASFVRQKWTEGYEVDTFHTFHWGERDENGVWRGDHRHVADVRHLQWESAQRQGLDGMFPVKLANGVPL